MGTAITAPTPVQRCRHGKPFGARFHDCAYVDFRVALIPAAEAYANEKAGPRPEGKEGQVGRKALNPMYEAWVKAWNLLFHEYITARVRERYGMAP